jgi:hypothetical protein
MLEYFMAIGSTLRQFGIFCGHLVYFMVIWYIFPRLGILYQEKSGNPAPVAMNKSITKVNADYLTLETLDLSQTSHIRFEIMVTLPSRSLSLGMSEAETRHLPYEREIAVIYMWNMDEGASIGHERSEPYFLIIKLLCIYHALSPKIPPVFNALTLKMLLPCCVL